MCRSSYTRSGARRSGDEYQDTVALDMLVEWLEHPERYERMILEADDAGSLDDIVAFKSDGTVLYTQVKFCVDPANSEESLNWRMLIAKGWLKKWVKTYFELHSEGSKIMARLRTNRHRSPDFVLKNRRADWETIADDNLKQQVIDTVGGKEKAREFFRAFEFCVNEPELESLKEGIRERFRRLGGSESGWESLQKKVRHWATRREESNPKRLIKLHDVRMAARWHLEPPLPQNFPFPEVHITPDKSFLNSFMKRLLRGDQPCIVLTALPGVGKSTFCSYLFARLQKEGTPVIRHHYFLSTNDHTAVERLDASQVAGSIAREIFLLHHHALGEYKSHNPVPSEMTNFLQQAGAYYASQGKRLILILDGLDHIWREKRSIEELQRLLTLLLPPPEGVGVVLATQPLDDSQLPSRMIYHAPRDRWVELPLLNERQIREWLTGHQQHLWLPEHHQARRQTLDRLTRALYEKSQGHPLYLTYLWRSLKESSSAIDEQAIQNAPDCPNGDIRAYYANLWHRLSSGAQLLLHLMAATGWAWSEEGLLNCVEQMGINPIEYDAAMKEIQHLLRETPEGLTAFHSSALVFVREHDSHQRLRKRVQESALQWLRGKAPEHLRWRHEWLLECELGNPQLLIEGPTRQWAVEAIAQRRFYDEIKPILGRAEWESLSSERLPRAVYIGMLRSYCYQALEWDRETRSKFLYAQLESQADPGIIPRLRSRLCELTAHELIDLADWARRNNKQDVVTSCFEEAEARAVGRRTRDEFRWHEQNADINAFATIFPMLAYSSVEDFTRLVQRNRGNGLAIPLLKSCVLQLRRQKDASRLRELLQQQRQFKQDEYRIIAEQAFLLALEQGIDLEQETKYTKSRSSIYAGIYAALRRIEGWKAHQIAVPEDLTEVVKKTLLNLEEEDVGIPSAFRHLFFWFLFHQLMGQADVCGQWIDRGGTHPWLKTVYQSLNEAAKECVRQWRNGQAITLQWFYKQVAGIPILTHADRSHYSLWMMDTHLYSALCNIGLELLLVFSNASSPARITLQDIQAAFRAQQCPPLVWIERYLQFQRPILDYDAVQWVLQHQEKHLRETVGYFYERARHYAILASLAAMHGLREDARRLLRQAAENALAYGYRKDLCLSDVLDATEACYNHGIPQAVELLKQIAPAIMAVEQYTDGDETRHLPKQMMQFVARIKAQAVTEAYIQVNEQKDLQIAEEDEDENAYRQNDSLGDSISAQVDISNYPPAQFDDFLMELDKCFTFIEEERIREWADYWIRQGCKHEVLNCLRRHAQENRYSACYEMIFQLALELQGAEDAYPWLVQAHIRKGGWIFYLHSDEKIEFIWKEIKRLYPERWYDFIRDTAYSFYDTDEATIFGRDTVKRLVKYLLLMGQKELAKDVLEQAVRAVLELVSPVELPPVEWVNDL